MGKINNIYKQVLLKLFMGKKTKQTGKWMTVDFRGDERSRYQETKVSGPSEYITENSVWKDNRASGITSGLEKRWVVYEKEGEHKITAKMDHAAYVSPQKYDELIKEYAELKRKNQVTPQNLISLIEEGQKENYTLEEGRMIGVIEGEKIGLKWSSTVVRKDYPSNDRDDTHKRHETPVVRFQK